MATMPCIRKRTTVRRKTTRHGEKGQVLRAGTRLPGWVIVNGKCKKARRSYKLCKRRHVTWEGVPIVLPCKAQTLTDAIKAKIDDMYDATRWSQCRAMNRGEKKNCRVVFFDANTPIMRRAGKKLKAPRGWRNRPRWTKKTGTHRVGQFRASR